LAPVVLGLTGIVLAVLSAVIWVAAILLFSTVGFATPDETRAYALVTILVVACPVGVAVGVLMLVTGLVLGFTRAVGRRA